MILFRVILTLFGISGGPHLMIVIFSVCSHIFIIYLMKIYLYNFDPFNPTFLGFTGVYIIFLISA